MRLALAATASLALLAACGSQTQVLLEPATPSLRVTPAVASLEVRDVSLPRYAASDALVVRGAGNTLETVGGAVWADTPERAMTLQLAGNLATITGARVAAEPWPFAGLPGAQVTVRVEQLLGQFDGTLRMTGQYAIAPIDSGLSDRAARFDITVPMPGDGPGAVASAQAAALAELSAQIARRIAR